MVYTLVTVVLFPLVGYLIGLVRRGATWGTQDIDGAFVGLLVWLATSMLVFAAGFAGSLLGFWA